LADGAVGFVVSRQGDREKLFRWRFYELPLKVQSGKLNLFSLFHHENSIATHFKLPSVSFERRAIKLQTS
jgi:hypothetical protein